MRYKATLIVVLVMVWASLPVHALTYQLELGQPELQLGLEQMFPVNKSDPLISIFLRDPKVLLQNGSERIGLQAGLSSEIAGGISANGRVTIDGKLRYEPKSGAFYLEDTRIKNLQVDGVPGFYVDQIRQSVEPIVRELMASNPIYVLDDRDDTLALSKRQIKSVKVRNGKVFVELAAF
jgi:hypothetical protein